MTPADLAHWYFRLNGFFTMTNFVLHPRRRGPQLTDVDILGVRFPFRAEFDDLPDFDDVDFRSLDRPLLVFAEITSGQCKLNGPWTKRQDENMHRLLRALGPYSSDEIDGIAANLYEKGVHRGACLWCALLCVGDTVGEDVARRYPAVRQKTWRDVIAFIHERFRTYQERKRDNEQWDDAGRILWTASEKYRDPTRFEKTVRGDFGLRT